MQIKINLKKTIDGFSAYAEKYNVFAVASDIQEIKTNILEALILYFEDQEQVLKLSDIELVTDSTDYPL